MKIPSYDMIRDLEEDLITVLQAHVDDWGINELLSYMFYYLTIVTVDPIENLEVSWKVLTDGIKRATDEMNLKNM